MELKFLDAEGLGKKVLDKKRVYNGWFGVGVGSSYYSKANLQLYAQWATEYLNSFLFVVADDIERYNLIVFSNLPEKEALEKAREKGDSKFKMITEIADKFPHQIEAKRWQELTINDEYQSIFNLLNTDYDRISQLKEHIDNTLWANIRTKLEMLKKKVGEREFEKKFRMLVEYAIEEISSIIYLAEFHVYPIKVGHRGERVYDNVIDRIYSKHYNHVHSKILPKSQRGNIYLQVVETNSKILQTK